MFGNPNWFREKKIGWGLTPTCWQGWAYTGIWLTAIAVPFVALMSQRVDGHRLVPEALVWLTASLGALVWDVRTILKVKTAPAIVKKDVLYIGDEQADSSRLATRNFDLQVRG